MNRPYITTDYHDLSYLKGQRLEIIRGWRSEFEIQPDKVIFLKDYPKTILIELQFSSGGRYKKLLPKAALATGDFKIRVKDTRQTLTGEAVTRFNMHAQYDKPSLLPWE